MEQETGFTDGELPVPAGRVRVRGAYPQSTWASGYQRPDNKHKINALVKKQPLVREGEYIAVIGAAGQIGSLIAPALEALYPGRVLRFDVHPDAAKGIEKLDVTDYAAVEKALTQDASGHPRKVAAVFNFAALLSSLAQEKPELADKVNNQFPLFLMENAERLGIRMLMTPSSMAVIEADKFADPAAVRALAPREIGEENLPNGAYGQNKFALEKNAAEWAAKGLNVQTPRLAGVLTARAPWPSPGTTEAALDMPIVAAAYHKVYGAEFIERIKADYRKKFGRELDDPALKNGTHFDIQVPQDASFAMVDSETLQETLLMMAHKDVARYKRQAHQAAKPEARIEATFDHGPVHNVYEYTVNMRKMAGILHELNPQFPLRFLGREALAEDESSRGKMERADKWPHALDTASTKMLIGEFDPCTAKESIERNFHRLVAELEAQRSQETSRMPGLAGNGAPGAVAIAV